MSDQQITCSECGDTFVFTAAEQAFYAEKQLASPPKRCKACRQARKASRGDARGGGGFGGRDARGGGGQPSSRGPRRFTGDVNEYRSPMSGGHSGGFDSRGQGGQSGGDFRRREGGPRGGGGRPARGRGREGGGGGYGAPRTFGGGGGGEGYGEYRSPAFPEERDRGGGFSNGRARVDTRGRGDRDGNRAPRAHDGASPAAAKPPRPERPKFDITCATCGVQAQVPFKPLEGREVFCQDCYRARRGTTPAVNGSPDAPALVAGGARADASDDPDTGIIE
jgi:CxxC-x17-CxxC domain-containing protein